MKVSYRLIEYHHLRWYQSSSAVEFAQSHAWASNSLDDCVANKVADWPSLSHFILQSFCCSWLRMTATMHDFFHHILYTTRKLKDQKTRQPKELRNWSGMTKRQCLHTNRTSVCWFFWFKSLVFLIKIIFYNNSQFEWKLKTLVLIWSNQFKFQFDLKSINCQIDLVSILTWFNSLQLNCDDGNF